jgi:gluconate 5-dehydrogenase
VGAAVFLSSAASSFVNGHTLFIDGGITASL